MFLVFRNAVLLLSIIFFMACDEKPATTETTPMGQVENLTDDPAQKTIDKLSRNRITLTDEQIEAIREKAKNFDFSGETDYERMNKSRLFNKEVSRMILDKNQQATKLRSTGILIKHTDILNKELKPNQEVVLKGETFTTNQYGMRDRFYPIEKPAGFLRIALLGGSMELGTGVADDETYENILEKSLNEAKAFPSFKTLEIINFAISGIHMPQHVPILERKVRPFNPDVVIYTAHTNEYIRSLRKFANVMRSAEAIQDYPDLTKIAAEAKLDTEMRDGQARKKLDPLKEDLYNWGLDQIAKTCKEDQILPLMIYLQALGDGPKENEHLEVKAAAEARGFYFIDLHDVFEGMDHTELTVDLHDFHPNKKAQKIIAEKLDQVFKEDKALRKLIQTHMSK